MGQPQKMSIFGKRKVELDEEQLAELEERILAKKKIRGLNSGNKQSLAGYAGRKLRKEPVRPWGKKERLWVGGILVLTALACAFLALRARSFKLPGFEGGTIIVGKKTWGQKASEQFAEQTKSLTGVYALYVVDLDTGSFYGVNENKVMQAASLIKLPLLLYAEGKVPEAKIEAMGKRSDNNVFRELVTQFGQKTIQDYIAGLGMDNTSVVENATTPKETGDLLVKIYRDQNKEILKDLTDTIFEDWLKKGIPEGIRVAHKYGRETGVVNDAGVVFSQKPFVLVIMSEKVVEKEADEIFPELTKMIYSIHNSVQTER